MPTPPRSAALAISIDLELDIPQRIALSGRSLDSVTTALLGLFEKYRLDASWAVADPAVSAATDSIRSCPQQHEIAVLGDPTWVGSAAGRPRFSRELVRRIEGGRSVGIAISTLVLREGVVADHADLLVKHGVTVVRGNLPRGSQLVEHCRPMPIRFGVWDIPACCAVPAARRWWPTTVAGHAVRAAVRNLDFVHFSIDAGRLVAARNSGLRSVERLLRLVARERDDARLKVSTLAAMADQLRPIRSSPPTHSILRSAAA